jgi:hypothetical protein
MKKWFLIPLRWQALGCALLALAVVGVAIAARANDARNEWQNLRDQHLAWASSPMKATCDDLWRRYEGAPATFLRCAAPKGAKASELPDLERWQCEKRARDEAAAVQSKLRDSACVNPYSGFGNSELIRYSPADPGPYEPWAYEYSVSSQAKPLMQLAVATAFLCFLLVQLGRLVVTEHHTGWKRACIVVAGLISLGTTVYLFLDEGSVSEQDALEFLISGVGIFLASLMTLLIGLRVQRWVAQGFATGKGVKVELPSQTSQPTARETGTDKVAEPAKVSPAPTPNAGPVKGAKPSSGGSPAMSLTGFVLLCVAFAMPVIGALLGAGNSLELSRSIPQQLGSLLVIGGVSFLITRNRSERAKSLGTLVVGVLMCLFAFVNLREEVKQSAEVKAFFQKALTYQQERKAAFAEFSKRFQQFNLASILTPDSLGQAGARAEARAQLAQYSALLAERKSLLQTHLKESERFVSEHAPAFGKTTALEAMKASVDADVVKVYDRLHQTQSAMVSGMAEVLDWAERNQGKVQFEARQARFASPALQSEFNALVRKLKELEAAEQAAIKDAEALQSKAEGIMQRNTAVMEQLAK